jgi:hypothetical protein
MTLALVFAMSGGAYAAKKYLITSTKQISPKVLKSLVGKTGAAGPAGPAGAAGAAGAQGPAGAKGETGAEGKEGPQGKEGKTGKDGKEGPPGAIHPGETLPSEATETGTWGIAREPAPEHEFGVRLSPISFAIPLETELDSEHVHIAPAAACTGSVANPTAAPGNLCVYEGTKEGLFEAKIGKASNWAVAGADKSGAIVSVQMEGPIVVTGSWAVTAE